MIFIIHGEDFPKSRETVLQIAHKFKKEDREMIKKEFSLDDLPPVQLQEELNTIGIFSERPYLVLDISQVGNKDLKPYLKVLEHKPKDAVVAILSDKDLGARNAFISGAKDINARIVHNPIKPESDVFRFIDSVFSKNPPKAYKEYQALVKEEKNPYYLFTMLLYGLRNITMAKYKNRAFSKMSPFVKNKASKQESLFTRSQIRDIYLYFYQLEKRYKTGEIQEDLLIPLAMEKVIR